MYGREETKSNATYKMQKTKFVMKISIMQLFQFPISHTKPKCMQNDKTFIFNPLNFQMK